MSDLALPEKDVGCLTDDQLAGEINAAHAAAVHHFRASLAYALVAGSLLAEAKRRHPGTYQGWVREHCQFAVRTARNYLRIYSNRFLWHDCAADAQTIVDAVKIL